MFLLIEIILQSFATIMNVVEMLQKQFQDSASSLQSVQREYSKMLADRQTLDSQLNENRQVSAGEDLESLLTSISRLLIKISIHITDCPQYFHNTNFRHYTNSLMLDNPFVFQYY